MPNGRNQDIAVVGSPSSNTELTVDLLQEAIEERLVGALVAFEATQSGLPITSVGQIVGIELRNRWHEDSVFRNLIKRTGEIPPITSRQDTRIASLIVGATFRQQIGSFEPDVLGMVPPTGTRVKRVDQPLLNNLLSVYQSEIFYLGQAYANDVLYPMWFKHFKSGAGGAGESYHIAIFGKTGSGKSVLAKNLVLAYARHRSPNQVGLLIIDPQGEFARDFGQGTGTGSYRLDYRTAAQAMGRQVSVFRVPDMRLDRWALFADLLGRTAFFSRLSIRSSDWIRNAADVLSERLRHDRVTLSQLADKPSFDLALRILQDPQALRQIYSGQEGRQRLAEMAADTAVTEPLFQEAWVPVASLFRETDAQGRQKPSTEDVVDRVLRDTNREIVVLDLSGAGLQQDQRRTFWSEDVQALLLSRVVEGVVRRAEELFGRDSLNALIVLDEAHRLAGTEYLDEESDRAGLRRKLIDGVRTTRKYGLGWMFISQSLSTIHRSILDQCRIVFFGFGLAMGDEFVRVRQMAGGDDRSMELYRSFRDPHSFPRDDLREFPFMAVGPVSPLAFSGRPLFFSAFTEPDEFIAANGLKKQPNP